GIAPTLCPGRCAARYPVSRDTNLAPIQFRKPLGFGDIIHGVGVEEWVEGLRRPCLGRKPIARGPAVDFANVFYDQGMAKVLAYPDAPQSNRRMRLSPGSCDRKLRILFGACVMQTRDQIARQKRTVRRCAQDPRNLR